MKTYSGPLLTEEGFVQYELNVEGGAQGEEIWGGSERGMVVDYEEGGDSGIECIIIPTLCDSHVHSADSVVREVPKGNIESLVGPGGFKEKELARADHDIKVEAIKTFYEELYNTGIRDVIEFRENGVEGLKILNNALQDFKDDLNVHVLSRPSKRKYDEWELNKLLSLSNGIGLSAFRDWDKTQLLRLSDAAHKMGKPLALHCSEDIREPIEEVLELGVQHLVHMVEATEEDLIACAIEDIPIVICSRSNLHFRKMADIPAMLDAGLTLCLGTDNAMLASPDMFREMETAYRVANYMGDVSPMDILMMATWNPRKVLNLPSSIGEKESEINYLVLETGHRDPAYEVVTRKSVKDVIDIVAW